MRIWPSKRRWKQLAIGLLSVVACLLAANLFMVWRTESRLQALVAKIHANGDPASIADLAPEPIPADQNAAAILAALHPRLAAFAKDHVHFLDRTPLGKQYDHDVQPTAEQVAAIRAIVEKYADLEAGIGAAAACDQYASMADFSLGPREFLEDVLDNRIQSIRTLARFCDWKMAVLIADGQPQQAAELGLEMLRIARLHDREPLLVNYLVGIAVRGTIADRLADALGSGGVTPELHANLDDELAKHDDPQALVDALRTERGYAGSVTAWMGMDAMTDGVNPIWMKFAGWPVKRLYIGALDSYDQVFEMATEPWFEVRRRLEPPDADPPSTGKGVLADLVMPALISAYEAQARGQALVRELRISNALAEYRDKHGRDANGLEELSLPREATIDPYSGNPLMLKHTVDGWTIYSVAQNGIDDGGDFQDMKDYGLAPQRHWATK